MGYGESKKIFCRVTLWLKYYKSRFSLAGVAPFGTARGALKSRGRTDLTHILVFCKQMRKKISAWTSLQDGGLYAALTTTPGDAHNAQYNRI
jgi:hypothetical protein